jgi:hypothetical protein
MMRRTREAGNEVALEDSRPRLLKFAFALDAYEATSPIMESHFEV